MSIRTSHVGSFPLEHSPENVERVISDLAAIGIDAPPYPQLRDFISIYLRPLLDVGLLREVRGNYYTDLRLIHELRLPEPRIPEAELMAEYVRKGRYGFRWLRAPVTGPFTLASRIGLREGSAGDLKATLLSSRDVLFDVLMPYVKSFIKYLSSLGYNIVFVDEPILGVMVGKRRILLGYSEEDIVRVINELFSGVPGEHGIHVCGRISSRLFRLLASVKSLNILNFEFHDNPQNLESVDGRLLADSGKFLAPGIASSRKPVVEDVSELREILSKVYRVAGGRVDLVSADCGYGGLKGALSSDIEAYEIGLEKLRRIIAVVRELAD